MQHAQPGRQNQLKVLLSDEELNALRELAAFRGLTVSDYVRVFIKLEGDALRETRKSKRPSTSFSHQVEIALRRS